jgi:hypothetical protein
LKEAEEEGEEGEEGAQVLTHTMFSLNGVRKSTPPQNSQLIVLISNRQQ